MPDLSLSCSCGHMKLSLPACLPTHGTRLRCYCKDCQAGAHALYAERVLDDQGGTDLFHTTPARLEISEGEDALACLRLSPKGALRWYASCCDTPMFVTLATPSLRFVGVLTHNLQGDVERAFGPVKAQVYCDGARPGSEKPSEYGFYGAGWGVLSRHIGAVFGGAKANPLFTDKRIPVVVPRVLSRVERKAATPE
ncbi:DUF6151 family protein [Shimia sp. SDUM112013]|uniref:DUF6151 family protein n=1 Tax=Shimia sp. SDUM112013 TaxID=3136160 RepID=UPI0032F01204